MIPSAGLVLALVATSSAASVTGPCRDPLSPCERDLATAAALWRGRGLRLEAELAAARRAKIRAESLVGLCPDPPDSAGFDGTTVVIIGVVGAALLVVGGAVGYALGAGGDPGVVIAR